MKQRDLLFLAISSFIVVIAWIVFTIYHNYTTSTIPHAINQKIEPITPEFDMRAVENIRNRIHIEPQYTLSGTSVAESTSAANLIQNNESLTPLVRLTPTPAAAGQPGGVTQSP